MCDEGIYDCSYAAKHIASAFRKRGVIAHAGRSWDGFGKYRQGNIPVWYCSPRSNGGVLVSCEVYGDTIFLDFEDIEASLKRIAENSLDNNRHFVWETITGKPF